MEDEMMSVDKMIEAMTVELSKPENRDVLDYLLNPEPTVIWPPMSRDKDLQYKMWAIEDRCMDECGIQDASGAMLRATMCQAANAAKSKHA